jgi:hypothetical protein
MASTPGMPHTGEFGSFKLDFVTPLHFGGTTSPMSSYIQDFTPQQFFSGAPPSWIQDDSIDADELQQDLDECRRKLKACEAENERLRELLHKLSTGYSRQTNWVASSSDEARR